MTKTSLGLTSNVYTENAHFEREIHSVGKGASAIHCEGGGCGLKKFLFCFKFMIFFLLDFQMKYYLVLESD
jgi:hypothetical protein